MVETEVEWFIHVGRTD